MCIPPCRLPATSLYQPTTTKLELGSAGVGRLWGVGCGEEVLYFFFFINFEFHPIEIIGDLRASKRRNLILHGFIASPPLSKHTYVLDHRIRILAEVAFTSVRQ